MDVARKAGVSRATVSYIVNGVAEFRGPISEETRQRVQKAIDELGYEVDTRAQSLRSGDTKTIGFIIPDIDNPHYWQNAQGVEQEARAAGYQMLLSSMDLNAEYGGDIFKNLAGRRIDGLLLTGGFIDKSVEAQKTLTRLVKQRLAIVEITDRLIIDHGHDYVISNYCATTAQVMDYLFALGHRRIGFVYGVDHKESGWDRLQPYQESLQQAGIPIDPELIVQCGPTIEAGYTAAAQMLRLCDRPTALLSINDLLSFGVYRAAGDLGLRVPTDLSVVGFDDIPTSSYMVPRLTTVSKDGIRLGAEAFRLFLGRIQQPTRSAQHVHLDAQLIIRESTGPAPQQPVPDNRSIG